ncbi:MAG: dihydroorotase [candidate division KSB1 bacterium]|nr:dihydroorotase [candidate division KSB1 bacterium]
MKEPQPADLVLIKGGTVLDPVRKRAEQLDVIIEKGRIAKLGKAAKEGFPGEVVDASGCFVTPGLLDLHVHLREPGQEEKETIATGCRAAMAGGFTAVCSMPNTDPPVDSRSVVEYIRERAQSQLVTVYPIAAITKGRQGEEISEMADLVEAGAVAFSDDGSAVKNTAVLRRALEYSSMFDVPIIEHCEDPYLDEGGVMNEGFVATELGLPGMPRIAEEIIVQRDLSVLGYVGGRLHIAHVSTKGSVELIRRAKEKGLAVTAEVTPHHLSLTDEEMRRFDANFKMNPPLRTAEDVEALIEGLRDGTIDAIASDHAPHCVHEKDELELEFAPFGVIGLETTLGVVLRVLVQERGFPIEEVIEKMTYGPARIIRKAETLEIREGAMANLTVFALGESWQVDPNRFYSKGRNTPFRDWQLPGKVRAVFNNGLWWRQQR